MLLPDKKSGTSTVKQDGCSPGRRVHVIHRDRAVIRVEGLGCKASALQV